MPFYENGNLREYRATNPDVDPLPLVKDITRGLVYLHSIPLPHGHLTYGNVLIDTFGRACISDPQSNHCLRPIFEGDVGDWMWQPPEVLHPLAEHDRRPSADKDVYNLGGLILEIYLGPLVHPLPRKHLISYGHGALLLKPSTIPGKMRQIIRECWAVVPLDRPAAVVFADRLQEETNT
jgi:serine/threonine protein kinase